MNGKEINLTGDNIEIKSNNFAVDKNGNLTCKNANLNGSITSNNANITGGKINLSNDRRTGQRSFFIRYSDDNTNWLTWLSPENAQIGSGYECPVYLQGGKDNNSVCVDLGDTEIWGSGIKTPKLTQTSLESSKKNIERMSDNALSIIKKIDIYRYNLKDEQDINKKHIGFVIGKEYNYSKEVTSIDDEGVDVYSFVSLCCKAIQEQQEEIEQLQEKDQQKDEIIQELLKRIEKLEGGKEWENT